ncbi:securin [Mustelus asterias]
MAVRIFVEKENELSTHTKNHPRLLSSSSITDTSLLRTPQTGKMLTTTPHLQQSARKALRDVNCSLRAGSKTGNSQKKKPDKVHKKKNSTCNFVKSTEKTSILEPPKTEDYPEIEAFIPYDPFDFEDFNVPEEHKLDHICLAGLPLLCLGKEDLLLKKVLNKIPSPLEWPSLTKESNLMDFDMNADILANLDEIDEVELPMMEDDF